ncbi:MAG TPA: GNAT family N-acetyltransferase [Acidimicrobiales bacterium]|nr:GNAT family N-acetyltransferase [Acidimicrobiales bacterium]
MTDAIQWAEPPAIHDALLSDGTLVQIRPIDPSDSDRLVRFHDALSPETIRLRFFSFHPHLSEAEVSRFTTVDHHDREALVAVSGDELLGVARYDRLGPAALDAEVAFVVADRWQGSGVGSLLLEHLAARARAEGFVRFVAETLSENRRMLQVFTASGLVAKRSWEHGVAHLVMDLDLSPEASERIETREHLSEAHSIQRLLRPHSVAVFGAGARAGSVGHEIVRSLLSVGFTGPIHPINPRAEAVEGLTGYADIRDVPESVDLAIVAIGADKVAGIVPACAEKGVRGLVVISGGFAELGAEGVTRQRELATAARLHGMRIIGPNCVGVVNTDPGVRLDASFGAVKPPTGRVALASQSGAVGIAVLDAAARAGIGISSFVSLGNKADVSGNDLLQFWEEDERTDVILLYLESFGNPAKFARLAKRIGHDKPIIAVKSGRTAAGRRAASSHTAAMAADDAAVDALLRHCGVVRVDTIDQLLDTALVVAHQPLPPGNRVCIIGNSGGPGIMAADACASAGLVLAELSDETKDALRPQLPPSASVANPVDLLGDASPKVYANAIDLVLADDAVDAALVIHAPTLVADANEVAAAIADASTQAKPVIAVIVGRDRGLLAAPGGHATPLFGAVEPAMAALGHIVSYADWRTRPREEPPTREDIDLDGARRVVASALDRAPEGGWLGADDIAALLHAYGVPLIEHELVTSADAAQHAARRLGFPVALKVQGATLLHKTDIGGVALGLTSGRAVEKAWSEMRARAGSEMTGGLVQRMAGTGVELIAGVVRDETFGPLVLFGMGGTMAELLGDRTVRVAPLSDADAADAVRSLRATPLLTGYRGSKPVDVAALEDVLVRLGLLARDIPEVAELDLNPVIASPDGVVAVDARVRIAPAALPHALAGTRTLPRPRPD